jgi:hypothetical protein
MTNVAPYEILTGVGELYLAPAGTAFPDVNATPGASWIDLGNTQDGVTVTADQDITEIRVDQETGPVKATRAEENLVIGTKLAAATLENLAYVLGNSVIDTPPGVGTIGTREVGMYRGQVVKTYALLFRGVSAYGDYPAQYEVPLGYFGGASESEYTKDGNAGIPVEFHALVDPNAATDAEKFGVLVMQDAAALP